MSATAIAAPAVGELIRTAGGYFLVVGDGGVQTGMGRCVLARRAERAEAHPRAIPMSQILEVSGH